MQEKKNPWKTISSRIAYENPWFRVREDQAEKPGNRTGIYGVVQTQPVVMTVALNFENEVYLVGMFRYPSGKYAFELPAGGSDKQDLLEAAKRELLEETGIKARNWERIGEFSPWSGVSDEIDTVFIARDIEETGSDLDPNEGILEVRKVAFEKVFDLVKSGEIIDGQTISALTLAKIHLGKI